MIKNLKLIFLRIKEMFLDLFRDVYKDEPIEDIKKKAMEDYFLEKKKKDNLSRIVTSKNMQTKSKSNVPMSNYSPPKSVKKEEKKDDNVWLTTPVDIYPSTYLDSSYNSSDTSSDSHSGFDNGFGGGDYSGGGSGGSWDSGSSSDSSSYDSGSDSSSSSYD